ncbi:RIP metalloprotease RseP [Pseudomonas sp. F1_0610]|uniref:RIP metalloprotease RseP n=1 Tax=Pseudomonas sp. F1_0610 TaxID=3114284 RepID=UPI0039C16A99
MTSSLYMIFGTLVALGVLVTFHEFGHFWVARRCGVKVLRFSVGFGSPLFRWKDKQGTEFVVAMIPLGGYVKMLDEREGEVPSALQSQAFNQKTVKQRMAIVAAGPIANFILAFFLFWIIAMLGSESLRAVIADITKPSLAYSAGMQANQEILAIDGKPVQGWGDVGMQLLQRIGEQGDIEITTRDLQNATERRYQIALNGWLKGADDPDPIRDFGWSPWLPVVPSILAEVQKGSPADQAGLEVGDTILAINQQRVNHWMELVGKIHQLPEQPVILEVLRDGRTIQVSVLLARNAEDKGFLGAAPKPAKDIPEEMIQRVSYGPIDALAKAASDTWGTTVMTVVSMKKMILGQLSVKNLSGPITIAKVAGSTAEVGLSSFLRFLAFLSVSLGVLNLLPIPVLDGGHLLFYTIEWLRGRPVPERIQVWGMQIGITLVLGVMVLAIFNDITRL